MAYDRAIDHHKNLVVYLGTEERLSDIPSDLACVKVARSETTDLFEAAANAITESGLRFDALIATSERQLIDAARLRQRFDIPGPRPIQAQKVRDKSVMKQAVAALGIRVPKFSTLDKWLAQGPLEIGETAPVVLKPLDGASSDSVVRFETQSDLARAIRDRRTGIAVIDSGRESAWSGFEVEEFISGPIVHIDGLVLNGELAVVVPSEYVNSCLDFANGSPLGSFQIPEWPGFREWVCTILSGVEITNGAFHLEGIQDPGGIVFLEIAHRVGGGRVTEAFEKKTGIHISVADVRANTDKTYQPVVRWDNEHYYGFFMVPGHHLKTRFCHVVGYEHLLGSPALLTLNVLDSNKSPPSKVSYAEDQLPLAGMIAAKTSYQLKEILETLFRSLRVTDRST